LILDADNNNAIVKSLIHAQDKVIVQYDGDHTANKYFYVHDRLGSVRMLLDSTGTVANYYTYDTWGNPLMEEESVNNPFRYAGYYWDEEIQLYYCNERHYDPKMSRFTSRDPMIGTLEDPMSLHPYLYCVNDAVNMVDPTRKMGYGGALHRANLVTNIVNTRSSMITEALEIADGPWEAAKMLSAIQNMHAMVVVNKEKLRIPNKMHF